jgi:hypothetical protein
MNRILACCIAALSCAAAAQTPPKPPGVPLKSEIIQNQTCSDCGVIRSIRRIERQPRTSNSMPERSAPSGLVATIPLDGSKPTVGSSTREDRRRDPPMVTYEVIVLLDDGRAKILVQDDEPADMKVGDKVRVVENRIEAR